jgi:hypothetical protein
MTMTLGAQRLSDKIRCPDSATGLAAYVDPLELLYPRSLTFEQGFALRPTKYTCHEEGTHANRNKPPE